MFGCVSLLHVSIVLCCVDWIVLRRAPRCCAGLCSVVFLCCMCRSRRVMLCCVVLRCVALCGVVLCCAVLCAVALCRVMLRPAAACIGRVVLC